MAKDSDKVTLKETWAVHLRGAKLIRRAVPGLFAALCLHSLVKAVIPYVTVYVSARIINELAGSRDPEALKFWIFTTIFAEAALALVKWGLWHWRVRRHAVWRVKKANLLSDKMFAMDFAHVDRQETHDLLAQVRQSEQWGGWGLNEIPWRVEELIQCLVGILGAIVLTVSLFLIPVPEESPLALLNHPGAVLAFLALLAAVTVVGPMCANRATDYEAKIADRARFGNRLFGAFGWDVGADTKRAADYRMYDQQNIARHYLSMDKTFGVGGPFAKLAAGRGGLLMGLSDGMSAVFTGLVYIFVCLKAWAGAFGVGSVTQYVSAITALSNHVSTLLETVGRLRSNVCFMRTTFAFLDIPNEMYQGSLTTEKRSDRQYDVEFKNVSFRYPGSETWALRHVNMRFRVGSRLAIVGENGSGKTTFIKLLCRLYDPQEGEILLNGIDIRKYNYRDYMGIFSVVFQDFQLLAMPLGQVVAGSREYDREKAERCLREAGFGERLLAMPKGLDTNLYKDLDKEGVEVSGGEAQKIAIARALYKNAPFIILDEPTAALDPIAEAEIYSKFNDIVGDKTAIYISHRLSSCRFCNEILVFHQGSIVQQGSHEALVADEGGKYHALWHAQAQYYTNL